MDINSLDRFVKAQERMYQVALKEIREGKKRSHWMWYIFPQLRELGRSPKAKVYGIEDLAEARAYLEHSVLRERLYEITRELLNLKDKTAYQIFDVIDDMKLKSCMTLFKVASNEDPLFHEILEVFFDGEMDRLTMRFLR